MRVRVTFEMQHDEAEESDAEARRIAARLNHYVGGRAVMVAIERAVDYFTDVDLEEPHPSEAGTTKVPF